MRRKQIVRHVIVVVAVFGAVAAVFAGPRVPQPLAYHNMADQRSWLGIPNALNVLSNLPFAVLGVIGLAAIFGSDVDRRVPCHDSWERWPYAALFAGVALTTVGSSYYHLAPDNARLVWDRLPMTVGFMGLLTAVLAERVGLPVARWFFGPLLALGAASVGYWYWSEVQGAGDLRLYLLVQFGSLLVVVLLLVFYPARCRPVPPNGALQPRRFQPSAEAGGGGEEADSDIREHCTGVRRGPGCPVLAHAESERYTFPAPVRWRGVGRLAAAISPRFCDDGRPLADWRAHDQ